MKKKEEEIFRVFFAGSEKKTFPECARAMARTVKLLWHDVSCPIHCTKIRNWND